MQAVLDREPCVDQRLQDGTPRRREPPALRRDSHDRHLGAERERARPHPQRSGRRPRSRRRGSSRRSRPRRPAGSAARRASSCRSAGRAENPSARITRPLTRSQDPAPPRGTCTPSTNAGPGAGSCASSRFPSRSTWSQSGATAQPGGDPEPRLDHAAEHHAEAEGPRGVHHPDRLTDAARLRKLHVDPVRHLATCGDVGERVAVLVDVDREGDAAAQLAPPRNLLRAAAARRIRHPAPRAHRTASSASSYVHHSFTSTMSGRSVTARTARTRSTSSPSPPPSFSLSRRKRGAASVCPSGHVVGIAEPDRPRRRGAAARQAQEPVDGCRRAACPEGRGAQRRAALFAACSPSIAASRCPDLLERERVVTDQARRSARRMRAPSRRSPRSARSAPPRPVPRPRRARW